MSILTQPKNVPSWVDSSVLYCGLFSCSFDNIHPFRFLNYADKKIRLIRYYHVPLEYSVYFEY